MQLLNNKINEIKKNALKTLPLEKLDNMILPQQEFYLKEANLEPIFSIWAGTRLALSSMPVGHRLFSRGKK